MEGGWGEFISQTGSFNGFSYQYNLAGISKSILLEDRRRTAKICVLYMLRGKFDFVFRDNDPEMISGKMYIVYLPAGVEQLRLTEGFSNWFMLFVRASYLKALFGNIGYAKFFFEDIRQRNGMRHIRIAGNITQTMQSQIRDICKLRIESPEWELTASAYGKNLLAALANALRKTMKVHTHAINGEALHAYILHNIESSISIKSIARAFAMNITAVKKLFRKIFNTTVQAYILQQRLNTAKELLLHSGDSIYVISMRTGFADASHFVRRFKSKYTLTPAAYRAAHGGKASS